MARFAFSIQYPLGPVYAIVLATSEEEKARWMQILSTHIATGMALPLLFVYCFSDVALPIRGAQLQACSK